MTLGIGLLDIGFYFTYFLLIAAAVFAVAFPLWYTIKHPAEGKKALLGVGVLVVVFVLAYLFASGEIHFTGVEKFNLTAGVIKFIGAGLNCVYILVIAAIIATVYSEVSSAIR